MITVERLTEVLGQYNENIPIKVCLYNVPDVMGEPTIRWADLKNISMEEGVLYLEGALPEPKPLIEESARPEIAVYLIIASFLLIVGGVYAYAKFM